MSVRFEEWWIEGDDEMIEALLDRSIWVKREMPLIARDHVMLIRPMLVVYSTILSLAMACS